MDEKNKISAYLIKYSKTVNAVFFTGFFLQACLFFVFHINELVILNSLTALFFLILIKFTHNIQPYLSYFIYSAISCNAGISILFLGWNYGFQLHFISALICLYYYQYIGKNIIKKNFLSILAILLYCCFQIYCFFVPPILLSGSKSLPIYLTCFQTLYIGVYIIYNMNTFQSMVQETEQQLKNISEKDELTKLYNRRKIHILSMDYLEAAKNGKDEFALAIFDLDNFKKINDSYGHNAGDFILEEIAKDAGKLKTELIDIGRWGGEEFLVLSTGKDAFDNLERYMKSFNQYIFKKDFIYNNIPINVSITAGITCYTAEFNINDLINQADCLLYVGKAQGKNCVICSSP